MNLGRAWVDYKTLMVTIPWTGDINVRSPRRPHGTVVAGWLAGWAELDHWRRVIVSIVDPKGVDHAP